MTDALPRRAFNRRTALRAGVWTAPAIVAVSAAPAFANSGSSTVGLPPSVSAPNGTGGISVNNFGWGTINGQVHLQNQSTTTYYITSLTVSALVNGVDSVLGTIKVTGKPIVLPYALTSGGNASYLVMDFDVPTSGGGHSFVKNDKFVVSLTANLNIAMNRSGSAYVFSVPSAEQTYAAN